MLRALAGVARAPFLLLPVVLIAAGSAAGALEGAFSWSRSLLALIGLLGLHVAVNAFNEASDFRTGIDLATRRTPFSGGSGTLPEGHLSERAAVLLGVGGFAVGLAVGIHFLGAVGWQLLPIFAVGAVAVTGYTDFLARIYLGELFAGMGLGLLPVLGAAMVQGGAAGPTAVAASLPAFFMTFNLLLLNEFPDEEADRAGGRRNLVGLLGRRGAAAVYALAAVAAPASIAAATLLGHLPTIALVACLPFLLLSRPLRWAIAAPGNPVPLPALAANVAWNLLTNAVLAGALFAAAGPLS